jgi:hypothetical protein
MKNLEDYRSVRAFVTSWAIVVRLLYVLAGATALLFWPGLVMGAQHGGRRNSSRRRRFGVIHRHSAFDGWRVRPTIATLSPRERRVLAPLEFVLVVVA